jgi:flagellar protein FliO/FliZ
VLEPFLRLLVSLAVIVGLLLVITKLSRKRFAGNQRNMIQVIARQPLSRTSAVTVLRVGSQYLVVGATEGSMTLLSELDPDEIDLDTLDTGTDATDSTESVASPITAKTTEVPATAQTTLGALSGSLLSKQTWKQAWGAVRPNKTKRTPAPGITAPATPAVTDMPAGPQAPATGPLAPVDELFSDQDSFTKTPKRSMPAPHAPTVDFAELLAQASRNTSPAKAEDLGTDDEFEEVSVPTIERPAAPIDARPKPAVENSAPPKTEPSTRVPEALAQDKSDAAEAPVAVDTRQAPVADAAAAAPVEKPGPARARPAAKKTTTAKKATPARKPPVITLPAELTGTPAAKKAPAKKAPTDRKAPARRPAAKKTTTPRRSTTPATKTSTSATAGKDDQ